VRPKPLPRPGRIWSFALVLLAIALGVVILFFAVCVANVIGAPHG